MGNNENNFLSEEAQRKFNALKNDATDAASKAKKQAERDLKKVKNLDDVFKLEWYYPAVVAGILLVLLMFPTFSWWVVGVGLLATIITAVKPDWVKAPWYWFLIVAVIVAGTLAGAKVTVFIILGLIVWAIVKKAPWKNTEEDSE